MKLWNNFEWMYFIIFAGILWIPKRTNVRLRGLCIRTHYHARLFSICATAFTKCLQQDSNVLQSCNVSCVPRGVIWKQQHKSKLTCWILPCICSSPWKTYILLACESWTFRLNFRCLGVSPGIKQRILKISQLTCTIAEQDIPSSSSRNWEHLNTRSETRPIIPNTRSYKLRNVTIIGNNHGCQGLCCHGRRICRDFSPLMPCFTSSGFIDPPQRQLHNLLHPKRPWKHGNELHQDASMWHHSK